MIANPIIDLYEMPSCPPEEGQIRERLKAGDAFLRAFKAIRCNPEEKEIRHEYGVG